MNSKAVFPTIGAYYQCYKQPKTVIHALQSFRAIYPDSTVVMVSNNGIDMNHVAEYFNCDYTHSNESTSDISTHCRTEDEIKLYIKRLYEAAKKIKENYIMILADDVRLFNPIKEITNTLSGGRGLFKAQAWRTFKKIECALGKKNKIDYFDGRLTATGDGCVIQKQFVLDHFQNADEAIKYFRPITKVKFNDTFPSDTYINLLVLYFGGTIGFYKGYLETSKWDYSFRKYLNLLTVSHPVKDLYNKEMSLIENEIFLGKRKGKYTQYPKITP